MTLNGRHALCCREHASFGAHYRKLNKGRPTVSVSKYRPMTLVSVDIRFIRIFAEVFCGGVKGQCGCRQRQFSAFSLAIFWKLYRWGQHYYIPARSPSSAFQWSQNAWPWMTLNGYFALNSVCAPVWLASTVRHSKNNCVKSNKDAHILSAAQIFGRESTFRQYKVCADIRSSSLERRR